MIKIADVFIKNIDIEFLREQRDFLLDKFKAGTNEYIDGLVNLIDEIVCEADGGD